MATVTGKITDSEKQVVPFAIVFQSDKDGKPVSNAKNTTSDIDGNYSLANVADTDYLTFRMTGLESKSVSVSSANKDGNKRILDVTLGASQASNLPEVVITDTKPTQAPTKPSNSKPKKNIGKYIIIGGLGLLALAGIILAIREINKGGKK